MHRTRPILVAILTLATLGLAAVPVGAVVAPKKVVIIVGPVGTGTQAFRDQADVTYNAAVAAGASAVKVYSPKATWANVKAAVNGANIVVYFGHGNGYPNPYTSVEYTDRVNGWGLNRTTTGGDGDDGYSTMAYCGEKAMLGTLTSSDGATQQTYCKPGPITPAAGWVMIYADACYAPGASQSWEPRASEAVALAHAKNYAYPALKLGASAYFATDMYRGSAVLVDLILRNPSMRYADITAAGSGYSAPAQRHFAHPDLANAQVWLQRTGSDLDYRYAFAGNPYATPGGDPGQALPAPPLVTARTPAVGATGVATGAKVSATFNMPVRGVSSTSFVLRNATGAAVAASVSYDGVANRADLVPASPLAYSVTYTASLDGAVASEAGVSLAPVSWTFTVQPDPKGGTATTYSPAARLVLKMGTHTGYRFDATGKPISIKTYTLGSDSGANTAVRQLIGNQSGSWFSIVNGVWAGYWVRQSAGVYLSAGGAPASASSTAATYSPSVRFAVRIGTHTGYQFGSTGAVTASRTYTLGADSGANTSSRQAVAHQYGMWLYVVNGAWAGYRLRESDVVFLP